MTAINIRCKDDYSRLYELCIVFICNDTNCIYMLNVLYYQITFFDCILVT